jgi:hypothetical protein
VRELYELYDVVTDLAQQISKPEPTLVLFFACGSVPYVFAALHRLSVGGRPIDRKKVHLFPGLSWNRAIQGMKAFDLTVDALRAILRTPSCRQRRARILAIDTTRSGRTALPTILKLLQEVSDSEVSTEIKIFLVVDGEWHRDGQRPKHGLVVMRDGEEVAVLAKPALVDESVAIRERAWTALPCSQLGANFSVSIRCVVPSRIFTEDQSDTIGISQSNFQTGGAVRQPRTHLRLTDEDGVLVSGAASGEVLSTSIVNILAAKKSHVFWTTIKNL